MAASAKKARDQSAAKARTAGARRTRAARPKAPARARKPEASASQLIDQRIRDLSGWRGETLARMRALILSADADMTEEWKWRGTPVWSHDGIVCTGETYAKVVKLTFARGAKLPDPSRLFNASLEGTTRRAIDIHEGERVDERAFKKLIEAAVALNLAGRATGKAKRTQDDATTPAGKRPVARARKPVVLLSGGNPQIAKADGAGPVAEYIAAMPGWKRKLGERLDALIERTVPGVQRAVKWNSPFYGVEGQGWFMAFHVFTHYVKVSFFQGVSLRPVPPGGKTKEARWIDIHEHDLDEAQMKAWIKQAAALPGFLKPRP